MFTQPGDFKDESDALHGLLKDLSDEDFDRPTQFKKWTVNDVVSHLHAWNVAADLSLRDPDAFESFKVRLIADITGGRPIGEAEKVLLDEKRGRARLDQWHDYYGAMAERFAAADPKRRVAWAGPDMSVRSSITARLMETWAHGQELYDLLGVERVDTDRIKNIAVLGVNTFGWTFVNRSLDVPDKAPYVRLTAPSGAIWEWNDPDAADYVRGDATEFCQVVTQVRALGDTRLEVAGDTAGRWMAIAQCFAGPPEDPPAPGTRYRLSVGER